MSDELTHEQLLALAEHSKEIANNRHQSYCELPTVPNGKGTVKCLVCDRDLEHDEHELVYDAGFVEISFHYGSRHDQCKGFGLDLPENPTQADRLLCCDKIEAYICDDCFEKKADQMKGFMKVRDERPNWERKV